MRIEESIQEIVTKNVRKFYRMDIGNGYSAYKVDSICVGQTKDISEDERESIYSHDQIITSEQGICRTSHIMAAKRKDKTPRPKNILILSQHHLDIYAKLGFHAFSSNLFAQTSYEFLGEGLFNEFKNDNDFNLANYAPVKDISYQDKHHKNIYDLLMEYPDLIEDLFIIDDMTNSIFNLKKEAQPVALMFDYMNGYLSNRKYDLEKVSEWIKERGGIIVFQHSNKSYEKISVNNFIQTVPDYNNDSGKEQHISFFLSPSKEEYQQLAQLTDNFRSSDIFEFIWDNDLFGLNKFSLEEFNDCYHERLNLEDDDDDDCDDPFF
jgi:hypothetical protein